MASTEKNAQQKPATTDASIDTAKVNAPTTESDDDAMRRRYREALERKHGGGPNATGGHTGPKAAAPTSNDKTKRTFRRKSGG